MRMWPRRSKSSQPRVFRPRLEAFEDRAVPSAVRLDDTFRVPLNTTVVVGAEATQIVEAGDGEISLPATAGSEFSGTGLPAGWDVTSWSAVGGTATVGDGVLTVDGVWAGTGAFYGPGRTLDLNATLTGDPYQHVGFGVDFGETTPWAIFSTGPGGALYARTSDGAGETVTPVPGAWLGAAHDFRVEWTATGVTYSIDGTPVAAHAVAVAAAMRPLVSDLQTGGGAVVVDSMSLIPPGYQTQFDGTALPAEWTTTVDTVTTVDQGRLTVDGGLAGTEAYYGPGRSLGFVATFTGHPYQHVGFGEDLAGLTPWAIFSTGPGGGIYARTSDGASTVDTLIPGSWLGSPHDFRIDWTAAGVTYWIDGAQVAAHTVAVVTPLRPLVSDLNPDGFGPSVDWLRLSPYSSAGGFVSRVLDAGAAVTWTSASAAAVTPDGTGVAVAVRTGYTPTPDETWTGFAPLTGSGPAARFAQYLVTLTTTDPHVAPVVGSVIVTTSNPAVTFTDTTMADFAAGIPGTGILADDGPVSNGPYTAELVTGPANGTLALSPDGSFSYTPDTDFVGTDAFVYQARGADGTLSGPKVVKFVVYGTDDRTPTLAVADASGAEGAAIPLSITADPAADDGSEALTVTIGGLPAGATLSHGTLTDGVWVLAPADLTGLTITTADNGTFTLTVTAISQSVETGATTTASADLTVTVSNALPTATPTGPGSVTYGTAATVQLTNPADAPADLAAGLRYAFALSAAALDSATYANSGTAAAASFSLPAGSYTVHARVIDKDGGSTSYQFPLMVNKAVLTVTADAKTKVYGAAVPTLTASYSGFVNGDTPASLTAPVTLSTTATRLSVVGSYPITAGGAASSNYTFNYVPGTLTVTAPTHGTVFVAPDPLKPGSNALFVAGTEGNDRIIITKASLLGVTAVAVFIGAADGSWSADFAISSNFSRIVAHGLGGNDDIWAVGPSALPTWLYGDDGNDRIRGGIDNSVLVGGNGDDLLVGSSGRDLLIGGLGSDRIIGGGGDDILIAGTSVYDANETALSAIMGVWVSNDSLSTRVAKLTSTTFQYYLIQGVTVFNDGSVDQLAGESGGDMIFAGSADQLVGLSTADRVFIETGA